LSNFNALTRDRLSKADIWKPYAKSVDGETEDLKSEARFKARLDQIESILVKASEAFYGDAEKKSRTTLDQIRPNMEADEQLRQMFRADGSFQSSYNDLLGRMGSIALSATHCDPSTIGQRGTPDGWFQGPERAQGGTDTP